MKDRRFQNKSKGKGKRRTKEVEFNIDEDKINSSDIPHVITSGKKDNDPAWYMNLSNLGKDMASIPFNIPNGLLNQPFRSAGSTHPANGAFWTAPGIMTFTVMPTIGPATSPTSPVNIAAQQMYTLTRKANSGAANYDKTDLMMLILAMDSAYMLYETLLRAYRLIGTYNYMNRYLPDNVLTSLGFDISLTYNLAEFRGILDMFAYKLASVNIPDQLDIIKRHSWMFSNIYTDAQNIKAQLYAYIPDGFYVWTEGQNAEPTSLQYVQWAKLPGTTVNFWNLSSIKSAIDTIMNPILGSEDCGIIAGDFAKAFGEGGMIKIMPVRDYESIAPVYSSEVLNQMMNAFSTFSAIGNTTGNNCAIIVDNTDTTSGPYLKQSITLSPQVYSAYFSEVKPIVNFIDVEPTPENVMVATRLITLSDKNNNLLTYGTEIVTEIQPWSRTSSGDTLHNPWKQWNFVSSSELASILSGIAMSTKFDWSPAMYLWNNVGGGTVNYIGNTIDLCNYTYLEDTTITNLHEVAVMSLFTVKGFSLSV